MGRVMNNKQTGAALIAVIIVVLLLSLLISGAQKLLNKRLDIALSSKQQLFDKANVQAKLAELTYLIATQRITPAGISTGQNPSGLLRTEEHWANMYTQDEIRVDGQYLESENAVSSIEFSVQAENGLIPINDSSHYWIKQYLLRQDLTDFDVTKLVNLLHDYADEDDWAKPSGGEKLSYLRAGLKPPENFLLQSCGELINVMEWKDKLGMDDYLIENCSLQRGPVVNLNAIPLSLWRILWPDSIEKVVQRRSQSIWFSNENQVDATELRISPDYYTFFSNGSFIVSARTKLYSKTVKIRRQQGDMAPISVRF